jgi:hypothetical protein
MRMGRAQHHCIQRPAWRRVGDIAPAAAQQRIVLLAHDRLADAEFDRPHRISPPSCALALSLKMTYETGRSAFKIDALGLASALPSDQCIDGGDDCLSSQREHQSSR